MLRLFLCASRDEIPAKSTFINPDQKCPPFIYYFPVKLKPKPLELSFNMLHYVPE